MTRAYLRLDPNLMDRKADYPDGAFRAFVEILCHAVQQPHRGRFRNEKLLRVLLDKRARWLRYLIEKEDISVQESGVIYVEGWDEWQEGDWTVADRVARIRARKRVSNGVTPTVTPPVSNGVSTPYSGGGGGGNNGGTDAAPFPNGGGTTNQRRRPKPGEHAGQHATGCGPCDKVRETPSLAEQDRAAWQPCDKCGVRRGTHGPSKGHEFVERKAVRA